MRFVGLIGSVLLFPSACFAGVTTTCRAEEGKPFRPHIFAWDTASKAAHMEYYGTAERGLPGFDGEVLEIVDLNHGLQRVYLSFDLGPSHGSGQRAEVTIAKNIFATVAYVAFFKRVRGEMRLSEALGPVRVQCLDVRSGL